MGLPPISFTGLSKFSENFQTILQRSFEVASLPIKNLQTEQTLLLAQREALSEIAAAVQALENRFATLGLVGARDALSGASSNEDVAVAIVSGTPDLLSFDLDVTSAASAAQESSTTGLPDSDATGLTADGVFELNVGGTVTNINLLTAGSGRTAGTAGAQTPSPPVSVQVDFSNGLTGSITASLNSFFVASQGPANIGAGDTITVNFVSEGGSINQDITTSALTGSETTADIAGLLNAQIALNPSLNGNVSFSDEGGNLKLVVSDTAGQGFVFTSSTTGTASSGLEAGGTAGGHSAEEIAAALNAQVALDPTLSAAGVAFSADGGEVKVSGNGTFDIDVTDSAQATGFVSGLAGAHTVSFGNTLKGLRDFINAQSASLGVKASILNISSDAANPEFHLILTATETGQTTLTLRDSSAADLLTSANQGTNAVFTVNGLAVDTTGNTIVNFAPGVTLTITGPGQTTVSVITDRTEVSEALAGLTDDYTTLVGKVQQHIGENAGILSGNVIIRIAQQTLRDVSGFLGAGNVQSMAALGLELSTSGQLSFSAITFNALSTANLQSALTFIGNTTSGFAGNALTRLRGLGDPVSGQIQTSISFLQKTDRSINERIRQAEERVDRLIDNLEKQFLAADGVLARLEAQQRLLTSLFDAYQAQQRSNG